MFVKVGLETAKMPEAEGFISRHVYTSVLPKVEYRSWDLKAEVGVLTAAIEVFLMVPYN